MDEPRRRKYWDEWVKFTASSWRASPYLDDCSKERQAAILCAFAVGVRNGDYGLGRRVTTQTVDRAIRAVGQTIQLACRKDPTKVDGGRERIFQLRRLLESYRRTDPPPKPQLAVPVEVVEHLQRQAAATGHGTVSSSIADLATIAFFFLLRVGEYTMPAANRRTRTIQFRVRDVTFYKNNLVVPNTAPLHALLSADGVSLCISNQKNGTRGETIHQHFLRGHAACPGKALARRVHSVMAATGDYDAPISFLGNGKHATAKMIREEVRRAVRELQLWKKGIKSSDVGSHSLRAGGAMAMKLNGCDLITIMKGGRWTSLTFLTYIHNQIAHLGANITQRMANPVPFFRF